MASSALLLVALCLTATSALLPGATHFSPDLLGLDHLARIATIEGKLTKSANGTGWDLWEVRSDAQKTDEEQVYEVGLTEGASTWLPIYQSWSNLVKNSCKGIEKTCAKVHRFFQDNSRWMKTMIQARSKKDPWWYQVHLYFVQLQGILDGYNSSADEDKKLTFQDIYMMNARWDVGTLNDALAVPEEKEKIKLLDSCSALIKLTDHNADILFGHNTWTSYGSMVRLMKRYVIPVKVTPGSSRVVPGASISLSSYPAAVTSGDDFYVIGSGLVVMETTNEVYNKSLYNNIFPDQVLENIRVFVANRLSQTGEEWVNNFVKHNSGTYNNQYMIIDYKLFKPGNALSPGTLWVVEQMPGFFRMEDVTSVLQSQGYWASYNVPYFKDIYEKSGNAEKARQLGDWYSHDKCPRALLFKREQAKVQDVHALARLLRLNNWQTDPLAACPKCRPIQNACNAIASRCELNPRNGSYYIDSLGHRMHGAIDAKATSWELAAEGRLVGVNGPAPAPQPFSWSALDEQDRAMPHLGQPDTFNFSPNSLRFSF